VHRRRPGFTLIEAILVMLLMAIIASYSVPSAQRSQRILRLDTAAVQLQADLARARSEAIHRNTAVAFTRHSATTYTIAGVGTRTLPNGVVFGANSSGGVTFTTYGTVSATAPQTFNLSVHTRSRSVTVNPAGFARLQ
jgi:prepilin-type N-terminal cleavage/methylation domain-containing protein